MTTLSDYDWLDCKIHGWVARKDAIETDDGTGLPVLCCPVAMHDMEGFGSAPCLEVLREREQPA